MSAALEHCSPGSQRSLLDKKIDCLMAGEKGDWRCHQEEQQATDQNIARGWIVNIHIEAPVNNRKAQDQGYAERSHHRRQSVAFGEEVADRSDDARKDENSRHDACDH